MATAGRILIMPKGTWNAETTYENLDMVAHSGRAWLAKKTSVGIEPSDANAEFWHDFLGMDVFTEENPPTAAQVGAVSLYADPVLSKSTDWDNLESGTYRFSTWGGSGGVGYPPIDDVGICILFDTEAGRYMYCLGMNRIVSRYYESKTWSDWIEGYIPLTGGTLNGALYFQNHGYINTNEEYIYLAHQYNDIVKFLAVSSNYDATSAVKLIHSGAKAYNLYGEHNKPSGSYVGNGTADERWIEIGGIGRFLLIKTYGHGFAILTDVGGVVVAGGASLEPISASEARYQDGKLMLKTNKGILNQNGTTIIYTVF